MMTQLISLPSFVDLRVQFEYDEETGILQYRKLSTKKRQASDEAGHVLDTGNLPYRVVLVEYAAGRNKHVFAHRIIWKLMTAKEPPNEIDHFNGNTLDNRWDNLRDGSNGANQRNRALSRRNTSGKCGVFWCGTKRKWVARVGLNGKQVYLGSYEDKEEAAKVARQMRLENGFTSRHGLPKNA